MAKPSLKYTLVYTRENGRLFPASRGGGSLGVQGGFDGVDTGPDRDTGTRLAILFHDKPLVKVRDEMGRVEKHKSNNTGKQIS